MSIEARLAELGIALPEAAAPVAAYVPVVVAGGLAHVSGQLPFVGGRLVTGRLGEDVSLEEGAAAARACALMILAQVKAALGSLDRGRDRAIVRDVEYERESMLRVTEPCSVLGASDGTDDPVPRRERFGCERAAEAGAHAGDQNSFGLWHDRPSLIDSIYIKI